MANFLLVQVCKSDVNGDSCNDCQLMHCFIEAAASMN